MRCLGIIDGPVFIVCCLYRYLRRGHCVCTLSAGLLEEKKIDEDENFKVNLVVAVVFVSVIRL